MKTNSKKEKVKTTVTVANYCYCSKTAIKIRQGVI